MAYSMQKMNIDPAEYMRLIYNLTQDWTRRHGGNIQEYKVKSAQDLAFVTSEQVLTEFGICYGTNNYLLNNISTKWTSDNNYSVGLFKIKVLN